MKNLSLHCQTEICVMIRTESLTSILLQICWQNALTYLLFEKELCGQCCLVGKLTFSFVLIRFQVLSSGNYKVIVFWVATLHNCEVIYHFFLRIRCLLHQDNPMMKLEASVSWEPVYKITLCRISEACSVHFYACFINKMPT